MPDEPSAARDELAALRAANARLRRVAEAKDTEIAALRATLEAGQGRQAELIKRLELRIAELARRLGMDSENSSTPPSKEPVAAKARRKAARRASQRERPKERKPGGQPGHPGPGLEPAREPDRTERADPPAECRSCGAGLAGAGEAGMGWGQVWDIPPVRLEKVHWLLPRLRCGGCGMPDSASSPPALDPPRPAPEAPARQCLRAPGHPLHPDPLEDAAPRHPDPENPERELPERGPVLPRRATSRVRHPTKPGQHPELTHAGTCLLQTPATATPATQTCRRGELASQMLARSSAASRPALVVRRRKSATSSSSGSAYPAQT